MEHYRWQVLHSQVSQAAFKAGVDPADRARLTAQASANKKDSKADKARQAANVAVSEVLASGNAPDLTQYKDTSKIHSTEVVKIAADAGFQTTNSTGAREFLEKTAAAQETKAILDSGDSGAIALHTGDRGDLKAELRNLGVRYKKDDSSTKLKAALTRARAAQAAPPPPVQAPPPPPQSVAQAAPTPPPQPAAPAIDWAARAAETAARAEAAQAQAAATAARVAAAQAPVIQTQTAPPDLTNTTISANTQALLNQPGVPKITWDPFNWANNPNNPASPTYRG